MHKFALNRINISLLIPALLLVGLSLITLRTIEPRLFNQQFFALGVSLVVYLIFLNIDHRIFRMMSKIMYGVMIVLLLAVFFVGLEARGSTRWLEIFGIQIQVSEVIKPFFVIVLASFLARSSKNLSTYLKSLLIIAPIFILVLRQPDLGSALIFLATGFGMMLMHGFPLSYFIVSGIFALIPMPFLYNFLHDYQKERIISFIDVTHDPFGSSYNTIQALISIGSGGMIGKGFDNSTQSLLRFLPEHHTDFIFATISENLGFIGGMAILIVFAFLMMRIYQVMVQVDDKYTYLVVSGFFFLLLTHIFFNIGMNVGILPVVGITLPFLSYGGSSLVTNFVLLSIVSTISVEFKKRFSFEIR